MPSIRLWGIQIAVNYWRKRGFEVVGFLPQYYINQKGAESRNQSKLEVDWVKLIVERGDLAVTPSQDYDDLYIISVWKFI